MSAVQYIPQNNFSSNILGFRQRHQALRGAEFEVINGIHTLVLLSDRKVKMFSVFLGLKLKKNLNEYKNLCIDTS